MTAKDIQQTKTRPANTTAYAAGDVINESTSAGTVWTFPTVGSAYKRGALIVNAKLLMGSAVSTALEADLFLFTEEPTSGNDNSADVITAAQIKNCVGVVNFDTRLATANGSVYIETPNIQCHFPDETQNIYGVLIARNAYVPESSEVLDIVLTSISLS